MKKIFYKNFVIFFSLIFVSCVSKNEQTKIRIVDLQGKSHPVQTRVPELNVPALASQGLLAQEESSFKNSVPQSAEVYSSSIPPQNNADYGAFSANEIAKSFQGSSQQPQQNLAQVPSIEDRAKAMQEQEIEYDLSESEEVVSPQKKVETQKLAVKKSIKKAVVANKQKGIFVQVGSFSVMSNAKQKLISMQKFHRGIVEKIASGKTTDKTIYRVLLGPFADKKSANQLIKKITDSGQDAILVRN